LRCNQIDVYESKVGQTCIRTLMKKLIQLLEMSTLTHQIYRAHHLTNTTHASVQTLSLSHALTQEQPASALANDSLPLWALTECGSLTPITH
jgi:hypothetical protein